MSCSFWERKREQKESGTKEPDHPLHFLRKGEISFAIEIKDRAEEHVCMLSRLSCFRLFVTLWTVACEVPLSMGFSRQEYWSRLSCSLPGDLPDPGIKPGSPAL